jgi:nitronate monooxygenase
MPPPRAKALMELFGLKYPIFEAPHGPGTTTPELAIAICNAGAMGALALTATTPTRAHDEVSRVRAGTKENFFINYFLAMANEPDGTERVQFVESLKSALDAGAPIVQFSWGLPGKGALSAVRAAGVKMGIQVTSAEGARAALDAGADYLVCQGTEAGGHVQATRGLYEGLPIVLGEAKGKPVIASGGIGNGQAIRQALSGGAWGAMLGTRFVATIECHAHPAYKREVVAAHAQDTALSICFQDGWPAMHRALRNRTFVMWDAAGCPSPGHRPGEGEVVATGPNGAKVLRYFVAPPNQGLEGRPEECALYAGLSVEHVKDVPGAGELVHRLWRECLAAV